MLRILEDGSESKGNGLLQDLDELAREGARLMLASALAAEPCTVSTVEWCLAEPMDSVIFAETNEPRTVAPFGIPLLAVWSTVWGAVTVACVADPKSCFGSCPTFYLDDVSTVRLKPLAGRRVPVEEGELIATSRDSLWLLLPGRLVSVPRGAVLRGTRES